VRIAAAEDIEHPLVPSTVPLRSPHGERVLTLTNTQSYPVTSQFRIAPQATIQIGEVGRSDALTVDPFRSRIGRSCLPKASTQCRAYSVPTTKILWPGGLYHKCKSWAFP